MGDANSAALLVGVKFNSECLSITDFAVSFLRKINTQIKVIIISPQRRLANNQNCHQTIRLLKGEEHLSQIDFLRDLRVAE